MDYLIPKSARNIKLQLFKGLGVFEVFISFIGAGLSVLFFQANWSFYVQIFLSIVVFFVVLFLVSPSFIANKKGYESFGAIFDFWASPKKFIKRRPKVKIK